MSAFRFATTPAAGHTLPGLPIARALIERGHAFRWYAGRGVGACRGCCGAARRPGRAPHPGGWDVSESLLTVGLRNDWMLTELRRAP